VPVSARPSGREKYRARSHGVDPPTAVVIAHAIILTALGTFCAGLAGLGWPGTVQLLSVKAADGVNLHGS
jgi:hypothetical protein